MRAAFLSLLFIVIWNNVNCQSKWDNNWILTNWMHFNFDSNELSTDILDHPAIGLGTGMFHNALTNEEGSLLFHSAGCYIIDKDGYLLESGDSLSPKMMALGYCLDGDNIYYQNPLIFPIEDSVVSFVLLNLDGSILDWPIDTMFSWIRPLDLYYTSLNYDATLNQVSIKERDLVVVQDTLSKGYLTACKHANGRDWWVIVPHWNSNCYFSLLIDPNGVVHDSLICTGSVFGDKDYGGQMTISPDGNWAARSKPWVEGEFGEVDLFTFDRCNGALEYVQSLSFEQEFPSYTGVSISPNSQYLYISHYKNLWQYDLMNPDIQGSLLEAGKIEYELSSGRASLYYQQLAPDGKIYIASPLGHRYLSTIEFPNNKGLASGFIPHGVHMPENRQNYGGLPNYPNYRLGPLDGSSCDTLGIDNYPIAKYRYSVPEGKSLSIQFTNLSYYNPDMYLWDFGDGHYSEEKDPNHVYDDEGVFNVCLKVENEFGVDTFCQTINLVRTSEEHFYSQSITYSPNPTSGKLYINSLEVGNNGLTYILFTSGGLEIERGNILSNTQINMEVYPNGLYFLILQNELGQIVDSKRFLKL